MKVSICTPVHEIEETPHFLKRLISSLELQTFQDFELVITDQGKMAENTNAAIKQAKGEIIKILFMDDYLAHPYALQNLVDGFEGGWLASGCTHTKDGENFFNPHIPYYNEGMRKGNNTIGSPSVVAFENKDPLLFDERMSWLLDCELYSRLHERYGEPTLLKSMDVVIGIGPHQTTHILTEDEKQKEYGYL